MVHVPEARRRRRGFTLIEVVLALTMLTGVVLALSMGTTSFRVNVTNSDVRSRAQARADYQLALARTWPTWGTLENLSGAAYNVTESGISSSTDIAADTASGKRIKRVTVTVSVTPSSAMPTPIKRMISITAP